LYFFGYFTEISKSFLFEEKTFLKLYKCGIDFEEELGAFMIPVHKVLVLARLQLDLHEKISS